MKNYVIDQQEKDNYECIFEELLLNGNRGAETLYAWFLDSEFVIKQSLQELRFLEPE